MIKEYIVERVLSTVLKHRFKDSPIICRRKIDFQSRQITSILLLCFFLAGKTRGCTITRSKNAETHLGSDLQTAIFYDNTLIRFYTTSRATSRHIYDLVVAQFFVATHSIFLPDWFKLSKSIRATVYISITDVCREF